MALDRIKKMFGGGDEEVAVANGDDEYYEIANVPNKQGGSADNKMILLEPRAYSESQQIAEYLKKRSAVVVNLKRVTPDQAKRIVDFLSGTLYAIGGDLQKLGGGIFLCTPNNVNVEGKMTDEGRDDKTNHPKGIKNKDSEEEFNW